MGRPKGSTNKQKKESAAKVEAELRAMDVIEVKTEDIDLEKGTVKTPYGEKTLPLEPPTIKWDLNSKIYCSECQHPKETHYGPKTDWCNTANCRCSSWK